MKIYLTQKLRHFYPSKVGTLAQQKWDRRSQSQVGLMIESPGKGWMATSFTGDELWSTAVTDGDHQSCPSGSACYQQLNLRVLCSEFTYWDPDEARHLMIWETELWALPCGNEIFSLQMSYPKFQNIFLFLWFFLPIHAKHCFICIYFFTAWILQHNKKWRSQFVSTTISFQYPQSWHN